MAQASARENGPVIATDPAGTLMLSKDDSTQIDALRVFCIFSMLSVHVPPYVSEGTIFESGGWGVVWYVYVDCQ
jgi:hypothetical protein